MADSGSKAMGSLYDLLLDYVDTARTHDSTYEIARALVESYARLPELSQREMAELCYVSQASLSRFCRHLGFDSFAEFKEALDGADYQLVDDYTRGFHGVLMRDERQALAVYRASLAAVLDSALSEEDLAEVPAVLDAVDGARRVAFFSHHFLWSIGRYFQGKMLQMGRYVELPQSYEHQREAAESLGEGDVAFICSINGSYLSHYQEIARAIFASGATVVVLTQNVHALYLNRADHVLSCGTTNENDLGKYAALMTIDYLVMSHIRRSRLEAGESFGT